MTKAEAAVALGMSVRSVERLVRTRRLRQGRALVDGRPMASYDPVEVEELRAARASESRPRPIAVPSNTQRGDTVTVSFRLSRIHAEHLRREGEALGLSPGEVARLHTVRGIERGDGSDAAAARELRRLREALGETFFNFLVLKCDTPKAEARRFVKENLLGD